MREVHAEEPKAAIESLPSTSGKYIKALSAPMNTSMKASPIFEIKVAIIGNVSAGKTTVLNALFRDKYGEVSMKRTTAGVNEFAICSRTEWALVSDKPRDSDSVLKEITQDNVELRASDEVKAKRFEIDLEEPLCDMQKDTQLVIVDIPGINEANVSKKYRTYRMSRRTGTPLTASLWLWMVVKVSIRNAKYHCCSLSSPTWNPRRMYLL